MRITFSTVAKFISTGLSTFLDNFALRSDTSTGLGTSTSGDAWQEVNGTINVVSGKATATSTPTSYSAGSQYPLSVVTMVNANVDIKLKNTNQGSTAAVWVQDSDEWWGVVSRATLDSTPGNTTYGYEYAVAGYYDYTNSDSWTNYAYGKSNNTNYGYGSSSNTNFAYTSSSTTNYSAAYTKVAYFVYGFSSSTSYSVGSYNISYSASYGTKYNSKYSLAYNKYTWATYSANYTSSTSYSYKVNASYYGYNVNYSASNTTNYSWTSSTTTNYYYNSSTTSNYYYNSSTTTNFYAGVGTNYGYQYGVTGTNATTYTVNQYLDIIRSTAASVSTITSSLVSTAATIKSILVSLSNDQITAKAYSDTELVTQIGSDLVYTATGATITTQFGISISPSDHDQSAIIGESVEINVTA